MNRAERRAAGFRGPAYYHDIRDKAPRYVRKHIDKAVNAPVKTRRIRKMQARIFRAIKRRAG